MGRKNNKKRKQEQGTLTDLAGQMGSKVIVLGIFIVLPFYYDQFGYTAMMRAKGSCYLVLSCLILIIIGCFAGGCVLHRLKHPPQDTEMGRSVVFFRLERSPRDTEMKRSVVCFWRKRPGRDGSGKICAGLFCLAVLVSCVLSRDFLACWLGTGGFYVGTYMVLSAFAFAFWAAHYGGVTRRLWNLVLLAEDLVLVWVIADSLSLDPFQMHQNISAGEQFDYFASIGQMDQVTAYISLPLPFGMLFYMEAVDRREKVGYGITLLINFTAAFAVQTDGIYIGWAVMGLFFFGYAAQGLRRWEHAIEIVGFAGAGLAILWGLWLLWPLQMKADAKSLSYALISHGIGWFLLIGALLARYAVRRCKKDSTRQVKWVGKLCLFADIAVIVLFIISSCIQFDDSWGNFRGGIWKASVQVFQSYDIKSKLIGRGMGMAGGLLSRLTDRRLPILTCHNNVLECLLALGIVGVILYFLFCGTLVCEWIRKWKSFPAGKAACYMALAAYFGQAVVGNPYPVSIPMAIMIWGIAQTGNQECPP